ncbi:hypothetical protein [Macrococcus armenti]|uniref:hypothetical protein n=1 Tax=Macrococcus armenti TaxID=2875764 RepID=UPI001CCF25A6|nr:hypothetical protein [Macrococcus armenti]UBH12774.1 hypothetical protein LAU43_09620 [Macrococcus armenti]
MKITTYAFNIHLHDLEYEHKNKTLSPANQHQTLIPIGEDFKQIELFSIEDNEGYFEGSITIDYNGQEIIKQHVQTCDLYMLWFDLYQTTISNEYKLSYLDIDFEIHTIKKEKSIVLKIYETKENQVTYTLPLDEYTQAIKVGLLEFYNHLNHDYVRNNFDSPYYFKLEEIYTNMLIISAIRY